MKLKLFFFISCFKLMLPVFPQAAYNLKNIHVFNPENTLIDVVEVDGKLYALLGYRPNQQTSGLKMYKANQNFDIEDSLLLIENKLQTYITNMVVNDDKTIGIAITKHTENEFEPNSFMLLRIDKQLKVTNRHVIPNFMYGKDIFTYANLVKLKNNKVLLNLIYNRIFPDDEVSYNIFVSCNTLNGEYKHFEDTLDLNLEHGFYKRFAVFNPYFFNDTITAIKYRNDLTISNRFTSGSGHIIKRFDENLNLLSSVGSYPKNYLLIINTFSTTFNINNDLYLFSVLKNVDIARYNPNFIQILPNDSIKFITNLDSIRNQHVYFRAAASNKSIVINKETQEIYGVVTYLTNNFLNWFGIMCYNTNFDIKWNRFYKFNDSNEVYINGMINYNNELLLYGWRYSFYDRIYRPLFVTVTQDGWLTGINETIVKVEPELNLYPNPAKQNFSVQTDAIVKAIQITNMQGKPVKTITTDIDVEQIDIADLPSGIYIVQLQTNQGVISKKLVVE